MAAALAEFALTALVAVAMILAARLVIRGRGVGDDA